MLKKLFKIFGYMLIAIILLLAIIVAYVTWAVSTTKPRPIQYDQQSWRCKNLHDKCGHVPPPREVNKEKEIPVRLGGIWLFIPKEYYAGDTRIVFYWVNNKPIPDYEFKLEEDFYEKAMNITIYPGADAEDISYSRPYLELLELEKQGKVLKKEILRKGLERWTVPVILSAASFKHKYLATELKDSNGDIPVLTCNYMPVKPKQLFPYCQSAIIWKYYGKLGGDLAIIEEHAIDFPEIYKESSRIMNLIKDK